MALISSERASKLGALPLADGWGMNHSLQEGRRKKEDGRRKKEEGRRKKEEGRRKKEEGRSLKEEG